MATRCRRQRARNGTGSIAPRGRRFVAPVDLGLGADSKRIRQTQSFDTRREDQLLGVGVLLLEPGLGLTPCVERPVAPDPLAVGIDAEVDACEDALPARGDAAAAAACPLSPCHRHSASLSPRSAVVRTVGRRRDELGRS